jgi:hypothetical protein
VKREGHGRIIQGQDSAAVLDLQKVMERKLSRGRKKLVIIRHNGRIQTNENAVGTVSATRFLQFIDCIRHAP